MKNRFFALMIALFTAIGLFAIAIDAEAARFGGGRSFGGSPSFSKPFSAPKSPNMQNSTMNRQQPGAAAAAPAGSRFGGMGGILGGVLAGTLLGSLLSGNGFGGGGFLDILLIGGALFLLFKFLGRRRQQQSATTNTGMQAHIPDHDDNNKYSSAAKGFDWNTISGGGSGSVTEPSNVENQAVPADFNQEEFMRGAKMAYQRLNEAWDKRDLDDISLFTTQAFMAEINSQAQENPTIEKTEILLVNANLLSVVSEAGRETATVFFDVTLREDPKDNNPTQVREVWHFVRAANSSDSWKLDGIQQVEG